MWENWHWLSLQFYQMAHFKNHLSEVMNFFRFLSPIGFSHRCAQILQYHIHCGLKLFNIILGVPSNLIYLYCTLSQLIGKWFCLRTPPFRYDTFTSNPIYIHLYILKSHLLRYAIRFVWNWLEAVYARRCRHLHIDENSSGNSTIIY